MDIAIGSVPTARMLEGFVPTKLSVDGPAFLVKSLRCTLRLLQPLHTREREQLLILAYLRTIMRPATHLLHGFGSRFSIRIFH